MAKNKNIDKDLYNMTTKESIYNLTINTNNIRRLYLDQIDDDYKFQSVDEKTQTFYSLGNRQSIEVYPVAIQNIRLKRMETTNINNPFDCWSLDYSRPEISSAAYSANCWKCSLFSLKEYPNDQYKYSCKRAFLAYFITIDTNDLYYMYLDGEKRYQYKNISDSIELGYSPLTLYAELVQGSNYDYYSLKTKTSSRFISSDEAVLINNILNN